MRISSKTREDDDEEGGLQPLREGGKATRVRARTRTRERKGQRGEGKGLKTISLAPYLTPACIRGRVGGWEARSAFEVGKGDCWR